jgi:hypothetical protein
VHVETQGKCDAPGASGEKGCYQFMPDTWAYWSKRVFGYIEKQTDVNEHYVALHKIQAHLNEGYNDRQVALIWNQGNAGPCRAGTNKHGVKFDSCAYEKKVVALLR